MLKHPAKLGGGGKEENTWAMVNARFFFFFLFWPLHGEKWHIVGVRGVNAKSSPLAPCVNPYVTGMKIPFQGSS